MGSLPYGRLFSMVKFFIFIGILFFVAYMTNILGFADFIRHKNINFSYERNDALLLEKMQLNKPKTWQEESHCIKILMEQPEQIENHALLFVGGFCDGSRGYLYRVIPELKKILQEKNCDLDIYYREHDELHGIKELFTLYHKQGKKIFIVGHSWGACSVFKQFWQDTSIPVELLISLDPVGLIRPKGEAAQIKKWKNVYLDYADAPWTINNCIARIGQPFGKRENAAENVVTEYEHQQAYQMFFSYAFDEIVENLAKL